VRCRSDSEFHWREYIFKAILEGFKFERSIHIHIWAISLINIIDQFFSLKYIAFKDEDP